MGISGIWNNMVNFIHDFGYLGLGYMEFPLIWDILAGTNASLITGNVCIVSASQEQWGHRTRWHWSSQGVLKKFFRRVIHSSTFTAKSALALMECPKFEDNQYWLQCVQVVRSTIWSKENWPYNRNDLCGLGKRTALHINFADRCKNFKYLADVINDISQYRWQLFLR